jgi:hypothetical protein
MTMCADYVENIKNLIHRPVFLECLCILYRVSQGERYMFWQVIVSVILSKKEYTYMCPIPNGLRDTAVSQFLG